MTNAPHATENLTTYCDPRRLGEAHMGSSDRCNRPTNVYQMMERLGIEKGGGVLPQFGLIYASAVRTCHQCERSDACHDWLKLASTTLDLPPKFCPDADLLSELVFDQPLAWRTNSVH